MIKLSTLPSLILILVFMVFASCNGQVNNQQNANNQIITKLNDTLFRVEEFYPNKQKRGEYYVNKEGKFNGKYYEWSTKGVKLTEWNYASSWCLFGFFYDTYCELDIDRVTGELKNLVQYILSRFVVETLEAHSIVRLYPVHEKCLYLHLFVCVCVRVSVCVRVVL